MLDKDFAPALIRTKLNRPPLPVDLVHRSRLTEWLDQRRNRPLTLVSAPAGYGKSTLISCWLESVDYPTAWLSLDDRDNEFGNFLSYFIAAIQTIFPDALPETNAILNVTPLPSISAIVCTLINEIDQIRKPFILVLDDFHVVETQTIHKFVNKMLQYPPPNLHLVLSTRSEPPLPLVTLRAKSQVAEIRTRELRFDRDETLQLVQKMIGKSIEWNELNKLEEQCEGWVTGLRLTALAIRHHVGLDSFHGEISISNRYVTEYLITEILAKQNAKLSDCMVKISILERVCADLCEAICLHTTAPIVNGVPVSEITGVQFINWLQSSNLFIIPLDDKNEWFRFHQLFRHILQQELVNRFKPEDIAKLHVAAGHWCAHNGLIEDALNHLLAADDRACAIEVISQHRYRMMNAGRWPRLERWLDLFPTSVVESSAELWTLKIWLVYHRGLWSELPSLLEQLSTIISQDQDYKISNGMVGEISSLQSLIAYHVGDGKGAIIHANKALESLPAELWSVRVMALSYLGLSHLMIGDNNGGYHAFYDAFSDEKLQNRRFKALLLVAACYFHWISADLQNTAQAARQSIAICPESGYEDILGYGRYNLGRVSYQQNDLAAAEEYFTSVVSKPYQNFGDCYTSSACGLVMTYQAQGREADARQATEATISFLLETGNITQLPIAQALHTELELLQGHAPNIGIWAERLEKIPPIVPMIGFFAPHLTMVKVWLAHNTTSNRDQAARFLEQLADYLMSIHNIRFLIETLALQALLADASSEQPTALDSLEKALKLARPGGFIRLFVDLGPQMARLLLQLGEDSGLQPYINQILSAFPRFNGMQQPINEELTRQLTNRETQVLELLGERLTNKEIASRLVISPGTVKAHTIRIYQKLSVNGRRQAVEKAIKTGILTSP